MMAWSRRLWAPLLVGLLVAVLLGVPGRDDQVGAVGEPRATIGKVMIPAAAFIPTETLDYDSQGYSLEMDSGTGWFTAPLTFPVGTVSIRRITLYAYDNGAGQVCATLYRASPPTANEVLAGEVCTANRAARPQVVSTTAINPRRVNTSLYGPYLWLYIDGTNARFYGVQVVYAY